MEQEFLRTVIFGAFVVESIVNIVKSVRANLSKESESVSIWFWLSLATGMILGVVVAVNYELDVFASVGMEGQVPVVGAFLTGILMSRGANLVSDVFSRLNSYRLQ